MTNKKENKKVAYIPDEMQRKQVEKYVVRWGLLGFLIGAIVTLFSIPINDYAVFTLLGKVTPGIDIWTNGTVYEHSAKAMWIYVTYSVPFVLYKMVITVKKVIILRPLYILIIALPLAYIFTSIFITGCHLGFMGCIDPPRDGSGIYVSFYSKTIIGATLIPLAAGASCIVLNFALVICLIEKFNLRKFMEKNHGR